MTRPDVDTLIVFTLCFYHTRLLLNLAISVVCFALAGSTLYLSLVVLKAGVVYVLNNV